MGQDSRTNSPGDVSGLERVDQLFVLTQVGYNLTRMRTLAG
jgi:hypothetical protein